MSRDTINPLYDKQGYLTTFFIGENLWGMKISSREGHYCCDEIYTALPFLSNHSRWAGDKQGLI